MRVGFGCWVLLIYKGLPIRTAPRRGLADSLPCLRVPRIAVHSAGFGVQGRGIVIPNGVRAVCRAALCVCGAFGGFPDVLQFKGGTIGQQATGHKGGGYDTVVLSMYHAPTAL